MQTEAKPLLSIKYTLEFEIEYDPFKGKNPEEFAESLEDDLHGALFDIRGDSVHGLFSKVESIDHRTVQLDH